MSKSFEYHLAPPLPEDHPEVVAQQARNAKYQRVALPMSEEQYCSGCEAWLRSDEREDGICEVCKYRDEDDFLAGKTCNPDAPEECESCQ